MAYSREELKEAGLDDFRNFLFEVWAYLGLPEPTPVQLDIAKWLQHGPKREVMQAFRGVGKSWITVAFVCWNLLLDPNTKIMVVSATGDYAADFTKFTLKLIRGMEILQHLAPRGDDRESAEKFDVNGADPSKDPSVKSVGITGQLTGSRADIIVFDDVEIPKNSQTHLLRLRLSNLVKEGADVLKPLPTSRILYLGTPQVEASLYPQLEQRGYTIRIWPAEIPSDTAKYKDRLAPYVLRMIERGGKPGDPVETVRFPEHELLAKRVEHGASGYALQYMLDTSLSDADKHPLKLADMIVMDVDKDVTPVKVVWSRAREALIQDLQAGGMDGDAYYGPIMRSPEFSPYSGTVMAIDPSGTGSDETAYAIVKYAHGMLYLVDVGGFKAGFAEATLGTIAAKALQWGVNDVIVEKNYGGGMFDALLKPHLARLKAGTIDEEWKGWSTGMKENRICDVMEPVLNSHRLVVHREVLEKDFKVQQDTPQYSFVQQLTRMARIKGALPHEDRAEAVSMAVGYYTERMERDTEKAHEDHKQDLLDEALRDFLREHDATGSGVSGYDTWA